MAIVKANDISLYKDGAWHSMFGMKYYNGSAWKNMGNLSGVYCDNNWYVFLKNIYFFVYPASDGYHDLTGNLQIINNGNVSFLTNYAAYAGGFTMMSNPQGFNIPTGWGIQMVAGCPNGAASPTFDIMSIGVKDSTYGDIRISLTWKGPKTGVNATLSAIRLSDDYVIESVDISIPIDQMTQYRLEFYPQNTAEPNMWFFINDVLQDRYFNSLDQTIWTTNSFLQIGYPRSGTIPANNLMVGEISAGVIAYSA